MLQAEKIKITHDDAVVAVSEDLSAKFPKADVFVVERFESIDEAREFLHKISRWTRKPARRRSKLMATTKCSSASTAPIERLA